MPLPIILWGAAAALAATGVFKGAQAVGTLSDAKQLGERSERNHRLKIKELDEDRELTNLKFEMLGKQKVNIFTNQIQHVVDVLNNIKATGSTLKDFQSKFTIEDLKQMESMVAHSVQLEKGLLSGAIGGGLAGFGAYSSVGYIATASTGTAISSLSGVAATNATLAWLGGGSLATGGFGMAGGMIALGGIVAGPALAIGGFMLASKAEEAWSSASVYRDEVEVAIEQIDLVRIGLSGLRDNADELMHALDQLIPRFELVKVDDNTDEEKFIKMLAIGKAIRILLNTNIMDSDGAPIEGIKQTCNGLIEAKTLQI